MRNWIQKLSVGIFLLLFLFFGQYNLSAQNQDSLVQALSVAKHDTQRIKTLILLSEVCDRNDILKYAEPAKKLCENAIANNIEPKKFYLSNLGNAVNNIGYYYSKIDYFEKALENYKVALKIHEQTNDMQLAPMI